MGILKDDVGGAYHTIENATTLIPEGVYKVDVNESPKFKRRLPLIFSDKVPASRGIRIHSGNYAFESGGCIIVGNTSYLDGRKLGNSNSAINQLIRSCGSKLEISSIE